jgi:hypothetical protein
MREGARETRKFFTAFHFSNERWSPELAQEGSYVLLDKAVLSGSQTDNTLHGRILAPQAG